MIRIEKTKKIMDLIMTPMNDITLPNKSILKNIYSTGKMNWVFLPGGPGLGEEYLIDFLSKNQFTMIFKRILSSLIQGLH
jgi:hypothetical protein